MIDKISDFFKDIKDRLSSPLFSSFIVAWLIFNWKVPVSLLWYNQAELERAGYHSHFVLINKLYNGWYFIGAPLLSAIMYCLLYPFAKYGIMIIQAMIRTWGTNQIFKASRESTVTMEKYLEQRRKYEKLKVELSELYKNESIYKSNNESLKIQLENTENQRKDYLEKLQSWTNRQSVGLLNSTYQLTFTNVEGIKAVRKARFDGQEFHLFLGESDFQSFICKDFHLNPEQNSICMFLHSKDLKFTIVQFLHFDNSMRKFHGTMVFGEDLPIAVEALPRNGLIRNNPIKVEYISVNLLKAESA